MKILNFLFGILIIIFLNLPAKADVLPLYTGIISESAIGFLQVPQDFNLHLYPRNDSEIIETIDNDKTELHFLDKTKKTEDSDGDTTTWYLMENSKTKKTGWIQKNKLEERID